MNRKAPGNTERQAAFIEWAERNKFIPGANSEITRIAFHAGAIWGVANAPPPPKPKEEPFTF